MNDYDDDYPPEAPERPPDPAVAAAANRLRAFFEDQPRRLFYSTQIETSLERDFFHWITGKALIELAESQEIQRASAEVQSKQVNFYANRKHRYWRREQREMIDLLERIFDSEFAHAVGRHGELMFDAALGRHGFRAEASNTRTWQGKTWVETNHNLDRIITRDGLAYGVEIKNTQNYISRNELQTKIRLCHYLEITPLFIMRFAPKSYSYEVIQARGLVLLFEEQMYPWGHADLLSDVRRILGLKVGSPRDVQEGHIQRFLNLHDRRLRRARH